MEVIDRVLNDEGLPLASKAVFVLLLQGSQTGAVCMPYFVQRCNDHPSSIKTALNRLVLNGYIERVGDEYRVLT